MVGEALVLAGSLLILLASVGGLRFPDALARMHALAKGSSLGLLLVLGGTALNLPTANDVTSAVLAAILHVLASPPASNMVSRAAYLVSAGNGGRDPASPPPT
jgi:multicomponent Na+:H+ antiporter subunit G